MALIPPIISVDDHVMEPPDLWQRYLPAKHREAGPQVVRLPWEEGPGFRQPSRPAASGPEADFWLFEGICQGIEMGLVSAGRPPEDIVRGFVKYDDIRPGCFDIKARLEDMDVNNVERSLCFPNISRFAGQMFLWMKNKDLAFSCVRAYNNWMVEEWSGDSGGRLIPLCMIPLWDPVSAAREVRHNAARGVRAVTFPELPSDLGLPSIHDPAGHWLPFLDACEETGTVVCMHIGSASTVAMTSEDAPHAVALTLTPFNSQKSLADWLFSGHLARFPHLKLALSESQIGWIPYVMERVDRIWRVHNAKAEIPDVLTEAPSSYMTNRVFGCFFEDDFGLASRDAIGITQITFETDYPHQDSTWPASSQYLERVMKGLSEAEINAIVRENPIKMLDLPETLPG